jgi:hypothetical protein
VPVPPVPVPPVAVPPVAEPPVPGVAPEDPPLPETLVLPPVPPFPPFAPLPIVESSSPPPQATKAQQLAKTMLMPM